MNEAFTNKSRVQPGNKHLHRVQLVGQIFHNEAAGLLVEGSRGSLSEKLDAEGLKGLTCFVGAYLRCRCRCKRISRSFDFFVATFAAGEKIRRHLEDPRLQRTGSGSRRNGRSGIRILRESRMSEAWRAGEKDGGDE